MATTAQAGVFSFGPQAAKGTPPDGYMRHRATMVDLGVIDDVREGIPEVGNVPVPTFPYKAGPISAGGFTLQPRLEDTIGWLLLGMLGDVDSAAASGSMYDHVFKLDTANPNYVPWMGFRKHIPRHDNGPATDLGQIFTDCKIIGGTFGLPNDAPITVRHDVLGRLFEFDHDPASWVYDNTFENWESIPVACVTGGFLTIDGEELPVVGGQVGFTNVPLDIRQEKVFGDPYIEDVTILQRRLAYDIMVKWNNPDLYAKVKVNDPVGTEWSATPFTAPFAVKVLSSTNIPTESEPYSLTIEAPEVMMRQDGDVQLAGNQAVMLRFSGVALETGADYCTFTLRNQVASYVWPTAS